MTVKGTASNSNVPHPKNQGGRASLMGTAQPLRCCDSYPVDTRGKTQRKQIFKTASVTKPGQGTGPDGTTHRTPGF